MNEYSIRLAKPHCEKCHKPKFIEAFGEMPGKEEVEVSKPLLGSSDAVSNLRSRLSGVTHGNLMAQPDDEGDI